MIPKYLTEELFIEVLQTPVRLSKRFLAHTLKSYVLVEVLAFRRVEMLVLNFVCNLQSILSKLKPAKVSI